MSLSSDTLRPFLLEEHGIRGVMVQMEATWRAVLERHAYPSVLRDSMGELLAAAALLTATLHYKGTLSIQAQGSGPVHWLMVECTSDYGLRATARWSGNLENVTTLAEQLGQARITITIDPKEGGERYQGVVPIEDHTVGAALEKYFNLSEQLLTRLWLHADAQAASGILLQKLPNTPTADPDAWERMGHLLTTVTAQELTQLNATDIIKRLFHEEDVRLFEREPVSFRCTCSRERVVRTLRMLGADEIKPLLEERGEVAVDCEFCNQHYAFDAVDIEQMFATDSEHSSNTQH